MVRKVIVAIVVMSLGFAASAGAAEGKGKKGDDKKSAARVEKAFKKIDSNGDGKVSLDEFKTARKSAKPERLEAAFKRFDTDNSGELSFEEFRDGLAKAREKDDKKENDEGE